MHPREPMPNTCSLTETRTKDLLRDTHAKVTLSTAGGYRCYVQPIVALVGGSAVVVALVGGFIVVVTVVVAAVVVVVALLSF